MARKKRVDARYCYDVPGYNLIFPYLLKRRCDSLVFYNVEMDVTNTLKFVKSWNKEHPELKTRLSSVLLAAILRTIALRPKVNRFIANKAYWERNDLSLSFVVKKDMTEDSPETSTPLYFDRFASFEETIKHIEDYISQSQSENEEDTNHTDIVISNLFRFLPSWLISAVLSHYDRKDRKGKGVPKWVRDADGLHVSIFVANIGSLGMHSAHHHHHLYEWGTTSLFCTIEDLRREVEKDNEGKVVSSKDIMGFSFTIDERICDGLYFILTIKKLEEILKNPEMLLHTLTPDDVPAFFTKEDYKKKVKAAKKAMKEAKKKKK